MDLGIIIMLVVGFASLVVAFLGEGGHLGSLGAWTAAMIVFGGTAGAVGVSFPMSLLKNIGKILKVAIAGRHSNLKEIILLFKELSVKTRKNGLLSLEAELNGDDMDPFIKKGLQMVVDGLEPSTIRDVLETRLANLEHRHKEGAEIFESAGAFAPTLGIVGTVMGLVHVLGNLSEPDTLGPKIAAGFIATLYGVASANLIFLPLASRLKALNKEEILEKEMMIEAILLIQEGANPNTLVSKLEGFLTESEIAEFSKEEGN
ncbi:chemotaxis protein MotA [Clostridium cavendishii DSM 21758]|uniref:Chemotaxis protein MotA n=1 Tax=Clostridium cavendishii DSM 21758 TaxID=1121302 RepID=A0A1M6VZF5_9CLOT|nr:flagellar motor protein [Clostridium cavendishii]SHK86813.1 chemotaxis protein MotA [Clostridium cavendishii DSM 21758]